MKVLARLALPLVLIASLAVFAGCSSSGSGGSADEFSKLSDAEKKERVKAKNEELEKEMRAKMGKGGKP
jgi:hypothetical protein